MCLTTFWTTLAKSIYNSRRDHIINDLKELRVNNKTIHNHLSKRRKRKSGVWKSVDQMSSEQTSQSCFGMRTLGALVSPNREEETKSSWRWGNKGNSEMKKQSQGCERVLIKWVPNWLSVMFRMRTLGALVSPGWEQKKKRKGSESSNY